MISASEVMERVKGSPKTAAARAIRRQISKELAQDPPAKVIALALDLVPCGSYGRWFAYEILHDHKAAMKAITLSDVERLAGGMADWGSVDCFGVYVSGPAWREGRIGDRVIRRWTRSEDRWWRRAALVSTVPLNLRSRGGTGDASRTLAVCERLIEDRDDMVVKAMSWALRALTVREPEAVRGFLAKHEEQLAARVLREVRNKLATGLKNPKGATSCRVPPTS